MTIGCNYHVILFYYIAIKTQMSLKDHQMRFEKIRNSGWYDPNTRDEIFICNLLILYCSGKEQDNEAFEYMLNQIPITNNVFMCLHNLPTNECHDLITNRINQLTKSRIEELFELL